MDLLSRACVSSFSLNIEFSPEDVASSFDAIRANIKVLEETISDLKSLSFSEVVTAADIQDYSSDNEFSVRDKVDLAFGGDVSIMTVLMSDLDRSLQGTQSCYSTDELVQIANTARPYDENGISYVVVGEKWPVSDEVICVEGSDGLYAYNVELLSSNFDSNSAYISKASSIFQRLIFHSDVLDTMEEIVHGKFSDYKGIITHALRVLNDVSLDLSIKPEDHESNINQIITRSHKLGRTIQCSRQGSNKPHFDFQLDGWDAPESVNCEFHQKINSNDTERLPRGKNVRIYFGLINHEERKLILVASIGKHF